MDVTESVTKEVVESNKPTLISPERETVSLSPANLPEAISAWPMIQMSMITFHSLWMRFCLTATQSVRAENTRLVLSNNAFLRPQVTQGVLYVLHAFYILSSVMDVIGDCGFSSGENYNGKGGLSRA